MTFNKEIVSSFLIIQEKGLQTKKLIFNRIVGNSDKQQKQRSVLTLHYCKKVMIMIVVLEVDKHHQLNIPHQNISEGHVLQKMNVIRCLTEHLVYRALYRFKRINVQSGFRLFSSSFLCQFQRRKGRISNVLTYVFCVNDVWIHFVKVKHKKHPASNLARTQFDLSDNMSSFCLSGYPSARPLVVTL